MDRDRLPTASTVIRSVQDPHRAFFPEGSREPHPTWFRPTEEDRRHSPVRLLVWDRALTSRDQLAAILRARAPDRWSGSLATFGLPVDEIREIRFEAEPAGLE